MCVRLSPGEESLGTRALGIIWAGRTGGQHAWLTTIAYRMVASEDSEKVDSEKVDSEKVDSEKVSEDSEKVDSEKVSEDSEKVSEDSEKVRKEKWKVKERRGDDNGGKEVGKEN